MSSIKLMTAVPMETSSWNNHTLAKVHVEGLVYQTMDHFSYSELSTASDTLIVRLLELQPGKTEDPLRCNIKICSLTEEPYYEAISYCWGPNHAVDQIRCSGNTYLPLNQSLSSALKRFRDEQKPRMLWADAICINQKDADEKGRQVNMMRQVYRQAKRVLIWLGDEEDRMLEPLISLAGKLGALNGSEQIKDRVARQKSVGFSNIHILSLSALLERPWFRRIWVVQEVAVASEAILYCGQKSLRWEELCLILGLEDGINSIGANNQVTMDIIQAIECEKKAVSRGAPMTLLQVLLRHRPSLATDSRDKVYALLGLCTDGILQPDYNVATEEVYKLLTEAYLIQQCTLDIITAPSRPDGKRNNTIPRSPSWVPDWSSTDVAFPLALRAQVISETGYQATNNSRWTPSFSERGSMLRVEAQLIDEVSIVGLIRQPYRPDKPDMESFFRQLRSDFTVSNCWHKICLGSASSWKAPYLTGETLFDVSWQVLLAGCSPSEYESCRKQAKRVWKRGQKYLLANKLHLLPLWIFGLMDRMEVITGKSIFLRRVLAEALADDFQFRLRRSISHRRMMRTQHGYLGLVPAVAQVGDHVALIKGLSAPVIVRQKGLEGQWEFVGDCYVHGIMNGEAFELGKCEEIWLV